MASSWILASMKMITSGKGQPQFWADGAPKTLHTAQGDFADISRRVCRCVGRLSSLKSSSSEQPSAVRPLNDHKAGDHEPHGLQGPKALGGTPWRSDGDGVRRCYHLVLAEMLGITSEMDSCPPPGEAGDDNDDYGPDFIRPINQAPNTNITTKLG